MIAVAPGSSSLDLSRVAPNSAAAERVLQQSHILLAADRPREAIALIDGAMPRLSAEAPAATARLQLLKSDAHERLDDLASAIDAIAGALEFCPDDEGALERITRLTAMVGRTALTRSYQGELQRLRARHLPDRLVDGLDAIWERVDEISLDPAAVAWAWELADQSAWRKSDWERAAAWGKDARLLTRLWWDAAPERLGELDALVDEADLGPLFSASAQHGSCLVISAHVGPTPALVSMIVRKSNRPFRVLGSAERARPDDAVISYASSPYATLRSLVGNLRDGDMVGLAGDQTFANEAVSVDFLGRRIELPVFVPKLIRMSRLPAFWCCPLWRGKNRIVLQIENLPYPEEGESQGTWLRRWIAAYLDRLERVMRGRPENLGLFSGIWSNVNETLAQQRRRQVAKGRRRVDRPSLWRKSP